MIEETLCPDCNKKMISRKSQYGTFWGCSDYPKCKGTRDSNGLSKAERAAEKENTERDIEKEVEVSEDKANKNDKFRFRRE